MKVGILTITPNIGYGGIMQSYALEKIVRNLTGNEVEIINKQRPITFMQRAKFFLKKVWIRVVMGEFVKYTHEGDYNFRSQNTSIFLKERMHLSCPLSTSTQLQSYINKNYNVVIVGSDQVWRPKYVHTISDFFLKGVEDHITRIVYAASFGTDKNEYSNAQIRECVKEIHKFKYISVRENSGVILASQIFNIKTHVDLDPTFLLEREDYEGLFKDKVCKEEVFAYILNKSSDKDAVIERIASLTQCQISTFNTQAENPHARLQDRIAPHVENWLSGIRNSKFVITDSFHGCVFSIIFNKPFLVYGNNERGLARFESLLCLFNLKNRLICKSSELNETLLHEKIDWGYVNQLISTKRKEILYRLKTELVQ